MGDIRVPGRLELVPGTSGGRLTFELPSPVHLALRRQEAETAAGDTVHFATSSPGAGAWLVLRGDSLEGAVALTGNRRLTLTGQRRAGARPDPGLAREQRALDPWLRGTGPLAGWGLAFPTFHPAGDRLWVSAYETDFGRHEIWELRLLDGRWAPSERVVGGGRWSDRSPRVTPDGTRLVFASDRPHPQKEGDGYDLWEAELGDGGPGEPRPLPAPVNGPSHDYQPHPLADGSLLFVSDRAGGPGETDVWRAERTPAGWTVRPEDVPPNTAASELSIWISDDGRNGLVASAAVRSDSRGGDDLLRIRRDGPEDGRWIDGGPAPDPVNGFANDYGATVSPDGRWLVFVSDRLPPAALYRVPLDLVLRE